MATNVVSQVRIVLSKAVKAKDTEERTPAQWAKLAGFEGSAASPLRKYMARDSKNGVGRRGRYPKMTAQGMLDLLELADRYADKHDQATQKRIHSKLHPAAKRGARQTKTVAKRTPKKQPVEGQ